MFKMIHQVESEIEIFQNCESVLLILLLQRKPGVDFNGDNDFQTEIPA
ncbi:hypothetical protein HanRHA438_Chr02g0062531 [Helianthus annuus]|nr:hypothetical protein HanRHA438_Chr02g0062531 [Helianthus annuus]